MKAAPLEKTLRVGSLRLDLRRYADGRFGFDFQPPGEMRVKVRLHDLAAAEERAREILGAARGGKVERLAIDEDEYAEFLRWKAERGRGGLVDELVSTFLETKRAKGISHESVRKWGHDLTAFAEAFPKRRLDSISRTEVETWLRARGVGPRRFNNILATVISLNRYGRRDGRLPAELCGAELVERRRVTVTVATYTPAELRALLGAVEPEWLPAIVLGAFCGIRPQEACPEPRSGKPGLVWGNILWSKKKVDVPAKVSKTGKRRFAPLTAAAAAFLSAYRDRDPSERVAPRERFSKHTSRWARSVGMEWRPDALRHSFASYRLALIPDMAALALELGNSPAMIFRHYLDLKHEDEAREWFEIAPSSKSAVASINAVRTKPVQKAHDKRAVCAHNPASSVAA